LNPLSIARFFTPGTFYTEDQDDRNFEPRFLFWDLRPYILRLNAFFVASFFSRLFLSLGTSNTATPLLPF